MSAHLGSAHIDPADNDTPASNSHEAEATTFAEAIGKVLKTTTVPSPNFWEQDPFHGSYSCKLRTFILQCKLNFQDHKDMFEDDTEKVNYVSPIWKHCSRLFSTLHPGSIEPQWLSDFDLFIEELEANFGTYDPVEKQKPNWRTLHAWKPSGYKILYQVPAATTCIQWGMQHSMVRLTMDCKMHQNDMVHHDKLTPLQDSENSFKLLMLILGTKRRTLPWNLSFKSSGNKSEPKSDS